MHIFHLICIGSILPVLEPTGAKLESTAKLFDATGLTGNAGVSVFIKMSETTNKIHSIQHYKTQKNPHNHEMHITTICKNALEPNCSIPIP